MSLTLEPLQQKDISQVQNIGGDFVDYTPERVEKFLSEKRNIAIVAKLDGKVVGLVYGYSLTRMDGKAPQFFIYSVDIGIPYQDKGYGSQLVKFAVEWARENDFSESYVFTGKDNPRACRVYEKAGMKHDEADCCRMYEVIYP